MNRHDRRKAEAVERTSRRLLKLRCSGCDRVGLPMTKEHFFPQWLIECAKVHHEGITWLDGQTVDPDKATIPLCAHCNETFGTSLEGPVAEVFRQLEQGAALSENEAELLVRWLWKFEGLQWAAATNKPEGLYTRRYTLRERAAEANAFNEVRADMLLAVALTHSNDPDFNDWPMGLDTPPSENALTMSGVFGRVALICSLAEFADEIPDVYGKYRFDAPVGGRDTKLFLPPMSFPLSKGAIDTTREVGLRLALLHDEWGRRGWLRRDRAVIIPARPRVELPSIRKAH
ncbi:hypothetical protein [Bradyrhizobium sp. SSUT77]|uniref:hypothetical protein n=1 Tax=Bradyrhizobium sp. SSUT77 TaxID=3040603 RepID=UPI0024490E8F|nr:hypothetical protein [Bradyrhizobium sp. SSUT77]MDH2342734.1 hypothetical protein [Bradyrhizobium sp. SSUT77]